MYYRKGKVFSMSSWEFAISNDLVKDPCAEVTEKICITGGGQCSFFVPLLWGKRLCVSKGTDALKERGPDAPSCCGPVVSRVRQETGKTLKCPGCAGLPWESRAGAKPPPPLSCWVLDAPVLVRVGTFCSQKRIFFFPHKKRSDLQSGYV